MKRNVNLILLCLMRMKKGSWQEAQKWVGAELMTKFENAGYLSRVNDNWEMSPEEKRTTLLSMVI